MKLTQIASAAAFTALGITAQASAQSRLQIDDAAPNNSAPQAVRAPVPGAPAEKAVVIQGAPRDGAPQAGQQRLIMTQQELALETKRVQDLRNQYGLDYRKYQLDLSNDKIPADQVKPKQDVLTAREKDIAAQEKLLNNRHKEFAYQQEKAKLAREQATLDQQVQQRGAPHANQGAPAAPRNWAQPGAPAQGYAQGQYSAQPGQQQTVPLNRYGRPETIVCKDVVRPRGFENVCVPKSQLSRYFQTCIVGGQSFTYDYGAVCPSSSSYGRQQREQREWQQGGQPRGGVVLQTPIGPVLIQPGH